ncbi:transcription repressor NadR [Hathewaya histolytica]|uniref:transcription repressor NadR n=1 Tax=Hathewaya histolytica TaxID=1498 RepID=UPI0010FDC381|nr:transcription repressor NadR [Hathewaya histolytica]
MNSKERRGLIKEFLISSNTPLKGAEIAKNLKVTRQVIVKDVALLRAEGFNIIATPEGYILDNNLDSNLKKIIAVSHKREDIENELYLIIKFGGIINDVIIEHPLYGEIRAMLKISNLADLENFMRKLDRYRAEPLSKLTNGIHLHTIEAKDKDTMDCILRELEKSGYLIVEDN